MSAHLHLSAREKRQQRRLRIVLTLVSLFSALEFAGAFWARSNVLKADALHLFMDILALTMSLVAMNLSVRPATERFTFGLRRAEPLAALVNAVLVLAATLEIVRNGIAQLRSGEPPAAGIMLVVSLLALVVNGISAWLIHDSMGHSHAHGGGHAHPHPPHEPHDRTSHGPSCHDLHAPHTHGSHGHSHVEGRGHDLNLRGAWLHLLGDALGSLAAVVAALVIRLGGPAAVDSIASFLVAGILILGAGRLFRDASLILLEASPPHLSTEAIRHAALEFLGKGTIHELRVWSIGAGHDAICLHATAEAPPPGRGAELAKLLRARFGARYVTVQLERAE